MKVIQLLLLTGPAAGRHLQFSDSPVRFGREADNQILFQDELVSRYHGELRYEQDQWWLVNLSGNGTKCKGKLVTDKPRALKGGEKIGVGGSKLFEVSILEGQVAQALTGNEPEKGSDQLAAEAAAQAAKKKTRLYVGIGIYLFLMFCGAIIFNFSGNDKGGGNRTAIPEEWANEKIDMMISQIPKRPANLVQAKQNLEEGRKLMTQANHNFAGLHKAFASFRDSLAYSGKGSFEDASDQLLYDEARRRFTERVINKYEVAYGKGAEGDYENGYRLCTELLSVYDDDKNEFWKHVDELGLILRKRANAQRQ